MTRRAWLLFAAMSVIWGMPYLFIKIAVAEISPATLVGLRTLIAALVLVPLAARSGALRPVLARWPLVLAFAVLEMAGPWLLLGHAETRISSGLAGLMLATVPIIGTLLLWLLGDHHALTRTRTLGLVVGFAGVALLVGLDAIAGDVDALSVVELLLVATGYAVAPMIVVRRLSDLPSIGVIAVSLAFVAVMYLPATVFGRPEVRPGGQVIGAVLVLGLVCTALAFVLFFQLIAAVGSVRATVITFVNPAVAVLLGLVVLGEPITRGIVVGFPLVLVGSWLATRSSSPAPDLVDLAADGVPR